MTPQRTAALKRVAGYFGAAALPFVGWLCLTAASSVSHYFVHTDDFRDYQHTQEVIHTKDSLVYDARLNAVGSDVKALVRDCQKRGGCP